MNKKEISEIKKLFTLKNCSITRLCGCYIDGEKNIRSQWEQVFLTLPEEEIIKYLNIFRCVFTGGLGKDTVNMTVRRQEHSGMLQELRNTQIKDRDVLEEFYDFIIGNLEYTGQYAVLTAYGSYDIPGKTKDGQNLEDASEEVYEFFVTCICPVNLQKPGLVYNPERGSFTPLETARMLAAPLTGFLYPAFNDRSQDPDGALCYCRGMSDGGRDILEKLTGSRILLSAEEERAAYIGILETVLGQHTNMQEIKRVEETLREMKERHAGDPEPCSLGMEDMEVLLRDSGIDEARLGRLKEVYPVEAGPGARITLDNLGHMRAFTVEMEEGKLVLDPDHAYKAMVRELDGEKVLVMPLHGNVEVNGIRIDTGESCR